MSSINYPSTVEAANGRGRRIAFYALSLLFVLAFGLMLTLLAPILPLLFTGWFDHATLGEHQFHDIVASGLMWTVLVGVGLQLWRPAERVGAMRAALLVLLAVNLALLFGSYSFPPMVIFLVAVVLIAGLHPNRERIVRIGAVDRSLLAPALVGAVVLIGFAADQINIQRLQIAGDTHGEHGHWALMAGVALAIALLSVSAALQADGRRFSAVIAGLLAMLYGFASLTMPAMASAIDPLWAIGALIYGATMLALSMRKSAE